MIIVSMHRRFLCSTNAAALPAAAVAAAVLSIVVAGLLTYLGNEYTMNVRSHRWTQALHLAEAAVEIGFAEYQYQYAIGHNGFTTARGWIDQGGGSYLKTTNLVDATGFVVGDLSVTVTGVGTAHPKILGVATCATTPRGPSISRAVRVILEGSANFPTAMAAKQTIDMNGNNVTVDSYDSSDPAKCTNYQYDVGKRQPNGNVATNSELANSLSVGNADVYGQVATGPNGTVSMGPNGSVGPTLINGDRATTVAAGEAAGWIRHDFQVDMPDVVLPAGLSGASSLGTINATRTINGGDWRATSISLSGSRTLTINGNVRLYVSGNTSVSGNGKIVINAGSSLTIYAGGSMSIAGNGVINNAVRPIQNRFFGLPGSTSWSINGNGYWIGTVYAPNANLSMNGGGANGDMSGSIVANSITMNGQVTFHYDESLSSDNENTGYLVNAWQSLRLVGGSWVAE